MGLKTALTLLAFASLLHSQEPAWDAAGAPAVVFNRDFPESAALAEEYARLRGIPDERLIALSCSKEEAISREAFNETIAEPLRGHFIERDWWKQQVREILEPASGKMKRLPVVVQSKVSILVLMHGIPSKIIRQRENPKQAEEDEASVDSELACLGLPGVRLAGAVPNPFHRQEQRFPEMTHTMGMLLIGRLDAASPATVRRMMDDAIAVEQTGLQGRAVIDLALKQGAYQQGDEWLRRAAQSYRQHGIPAWVDRSEPILREAWPLPDTALYFGWYTGEIAGALKSPSFRFKRGAVACHLHSFSASIIRTSTQAWVGPLLDHGAAVTMGNVWEPYLSMTIHFDIFNDRLLKGWTVAEAAWCATPVLSWMNVVLGDPLYRPFAHSNMGDDQDRDYSLLQALAKRHASDSSTAALKRQVLKIGQDRNNPHIIELLGLLSSQEGKTDEAISMLKHAGTLYQDANNRLRTALYQADLMRQDKPAALALLRLCAGDDTLKGAQGYTLIKTLIAEMQ
jgi:uncharacterized protein (TIGR03790 family)